MESQVLGLGIFVGVKKRNKTQYDLTTVFIISTTLCQVPIAYVDDNCYIHHCGQHTNFILYSDLIFYIDLICSTDSFSSYLIHQTFLVTRTNFDLSILAMSCLHIMLQEVCVNNSLHI